MDNLFLLMWLEAPLQSWGSDSKFYRRETLKFPTKSGILGLICCALGAGGKQELLLSRLTSLSMNVISYARTKSHSPNEKLDKNFILRDFHMVGSGYDESNPREVMFIPKTIEGKNPVGGGTKITYRYYLQDAAFAVVMEIERDLACSVAEALQNPVWDIYFGRKNCVPSEFIFQGTYPNETLALEAASKIASEKSLIEDFRVLDGEYEGDVFSLNDVPLQFGMNKKYRERVVTMVVA